MVLKLSGWPIVGQFFFSSQQSQRKGEPRLGVPCYLLLVYIDFPELPRV